MSESPPYFVFLYKLLEIYKVFYNNTAIKGVNHGILYLKIVEIYRVFNIAETNLFGYFQVLVMVCPYDRTHNPGRMRQDFV